jgi:uncharacterized membrane protein
MPLLNLIKNPIFLYLLITLPFSLFIWDIFNTLDDRAFLNGFFQSSNPYLNTRSLQDVFWQNFSWKVNWPYPPITILIVLPAWIIYNLTNSEPLFQITFKLIQIIPAITSYFLIKNNIDKKSAKLWLLNPLIIALSIQGGFQILTAYLIVLAYLLFKNKKYYLSALILGISSALRIYPAILIIPFIFPFIKKIQLNKAFSFFLISILPFFLQFIPFVIQNPSAFLQTFFQAHSTYLGPLGSWPVIHRACQKFLPLINSYCSQQSLYMSLSIFTVILLLIWYAYSFLKNIPLLTNVVVTLGIFYLFYPKMHMGYTLPLFLLGFLFYKS